MKASLQQQPMYCSRDHNYTSRLNQQYEKSTQYFGLKISPRKCQLFKTDLQYMGNTIFIQGKRVCVKPLHSRLEEIQKLEPPKTVK